MHDKEGLIKYLNDRLDAAISYRHQIGIERRLRQADEIMFGNNATCNERDMNQNFLRRKIFSLYTLLTNQLESQRQKAVGIEITDSDDAPDELYESVADELIDELLYQKNIVPDGYAASVTPFLEATKYYYDIRIERLRKDIEEVLAGVEPKLRKILFSQRNKEELRKVLLDYVMYPSAFLIGVYTEKAFDTDFIRGEVVRNSKRTIGFRRVSPWRVFPVASRRSISTGGNVFVVEDFTIEDLQSMVGGKNYDAEGLGSIIDSVNDESPKSNHCTWFNKRLDKVDQRGDSDSHHFKDEKGVARGVMYDGCVPNKFLVKDGEGFSFGQIWFIDEDIFYQKTNKEQHKPALMSASFRPGNNGSWGVGTVDICYKIQKTIDFVGKKIVGNLEKTSDFQGLLDSAVAKSMISDKKAGDGDVDMDITGVKVADLPRNGASPFFSFNVRNTQQSGILLINELKKHIAELLSLPDFVDGSTNVGTVGRTSGGLFLLQRNLSEGIELVRKEFVENLIIPIARSILQQLKDDGRLSKVILNYDVVVRDFALQEERSESADETLKKVQAIAQLNQILQSQGVPVQDNEVLSNLHDSIIKDVVPNFSQSEELQPGQFQQNQGGLGQDEI